MMINKKYFAIFTNKEESYLHMLVPLKRYWLLEKVMKWNLQE